MPWHFFLASRGFQHNILARKFCLWVRYQKQNMVWIAAPTILKSSMFSLPTSPDPPSVTLWGASTKLLVDLVLLQNGRRSHTCLASCPVENKKISSICCHLVSPNNECKFNLLHAALPRRLPTWNQIHEFNLLSLGIADQKSQLRPDAFSTAEQIA